MEDETIPTSLSSICTVCEGSIDARALRFDIIDVLSKRQVGQGPAGSPDSRTRMFIWHASHTKQALKSSSQLVIVIRLRFIRDALVLVY